MDFERSIFENRAALGRPFLAAHRGGRGQHPLQHPGGL